MSGATSGRVRGIATPDTIKLVTTTCLILGLASLLFSLQSGTEFLTGAGAILITSLAAAEFWLCRRVISSFGSDEPLYRAWFLIGLSSGFNFAAMLCSQILSSESAINPFYLFWGHSTVQTLNLLQFGLTLGGPVRFLLLAAGLFVALKVYRNAGFLGRFKLTDHLMLATAVAYVATEFILVVQAWIGGRLPSVDQILHWPVAPTMVVLLAEALMIRRSVAMTGAGWVGRCWSAFAAGIALTLLGDIGLLLSRMGILSGPWLALSWYIWIPAAGFFTLGAAYQWEVIRCAAVGRAPAYSGRNIW